MQQTEHDEKSDVERQSDGLTPKPLKGFLEAVGVLFVLGLIIGFFAYLSFSR